VVVHVRIDAGAPLDIAAAAEHRKHHVVVQHERLQVAQVIEHALQVELVFGAVAVRQHVPRIDAVGQRDARQALRGALGRIAMVGVEREQIREVLYLGNVPDGEVDRVERGVVVERVGHVCDAARVPIDIGDLRQALAVHEYLGHRSGMAGDDARP